MYLKLFFTGLIIGIVALVLILKESKTALPLPEFLKEQIASDLERINVSREAIDATWEKVKDLNQSFVRFTSEKKKLKQSVVRDACNKRIRLHHYWARDLDFLYQHKLPRYARWIGEEAALKKVKIEEQMNDFFDPIILDVINRNQNSLNFPKQN